jgi:hypothetical protein
LFGGFSGVIGTFLSVLIQILAYSGEQTKTLPDNNCSLEVLVDLHHEICFYVILVVIFAF